MSAARNRLRKRRRYGQRRFVGEALETRIALDGSGGLGDIAPQEIPTISLDDNLIFDVGFELSGVSVTEPAVVEDRFDGDNAVVDSVIGEIAIGDTAVANEGVANEAVGNNAAGDNNHVVAQPDWVPVFGWSSISFGELTSGDRTNSFLGGSSTRLTVDVLDSTYTNVRGTVLAETAPTLDVEADGIERISGQSSSQRLTGESYTVAGGNSWLAVEGAGTVRERLQQVSGETGSSDYRYHSHGSIDDRGANEDADPVTVTMQNNDRSIDRLNAAESIQPSTRIVNNTILGHVVSGDILAGTADQGVAETMKDPSVIPLPNPGEGFLPVDPSPGSGLRDSTPIAASDVSPTEPTESGQRSGAAEAVVQVLPPSKAGQSEKTPAALSRDAYFAVHQSRLPVGWTAQSSASQSRQFVRHDAEHAVTGQEDTSIAATALLPVDVPIAFAGSPTAAMVRHLIASTVAIESVIAVAPTPSSDLAVSCGDEIDSPLGGASAVTGRTEIRDLLMSKYRPLTVLVGVSLVSAHLIAERRIEPSGKVGSRTANLRLDLDW